MLKRKRRQIWNHKPEPPWHNWSAIHSITLKIPQSVCDDSKSMEFCGKKKKTMWQVYERYYHDNVAFSHSHTCIPYMHLVIPIELKLHHRRKHIGTQFNFQIVKPPTMEYTYDMLLSSFPFRISISNSRNNHREIEKIRKWFAIRLNKSSYWVLVVRAHAIGCCRWHKLYCHLFVLKCLFDDDIDSN